MESVRIAPAEGLLCYPCRAVPPMFARAVAYAVYQDELREMIHLLKYERMRGVARLLGGMLAEAILMLHAEAAPELAAVAVGQLIGRSVRGETTSAIAPEASGK